MFHAVHILRICSLALLCTYSCVRFPTSILTPFKQADPSFRSRGVSGTKADRHLQSRLLAALKWGPRHLYVLPSPSVRFSARLLFMVTSLLSPDCVPLWFPDRFLLRPQPLSHTLTYLIYFYTGAVCILGLLSASFLKFVLISLPRLGSIRITTALTIFQVECSLLRDLGVEARSTFAVCAPPAPALSFQVASSQPRTLFGG
ncbi:hypothetical protein FA13DRAFT_1317813 [Coprinellus micaceus]|uniref:Transmembrane protein n=1 Tax=Coprinellus micaceus TaxID=71717 RepID=A0A4Y7SRZ8_COPMI|nr:hypothetical protein FA13DRAFT_1317813 [Coprinellus micaceus]